MAIEFTKPSELSATGSVSATDAIVVDNGSVVAKATPQQLVDAGRPIASEAQAIEGVSNETAMTPLTTKQAIDAKEAATGPTIKALYEAQPNTNAFTDSAQMVTGRIGSRGAAQATSVTATAGRINVQSASGKTLRYFRDNTGTALTTADGQNWSPDGLPTLEHWGLVYFDRSAHATNGAAVNAALAWCGANGGELDFGEGAFANSIPVVQSLPCNVRGRGVNHFNKNGAVTSNLPAKTQMYMVGTGAKNQTMFGVSDMSAWGCGITNKSPQAGYNDSTYRLNSYVNGSATAGGQTLRAFSAAWTIEKEAEGSLIEGIRIIPDHGGTDGFDGYSDGDTTIDAPFSAGAWDVGVFVKAAKNVHLDMQAVGHWRDRTGLLVMCHSAAFPSTALHVNLHDSVFSGVAIRAVDSAPITATTSTTVEVPWADNHPFTAGGDNRVRLAAGSRGGTLHTFTSTTRVANGVASGVDSLRLNGVSPDPSGNGYDVARPYSVGGGTSHMVSGNMSIIGFGHGSNEPCENTSMATPFTTSMALLQISGDQITEIDFSKASMSGHERVAWFLGDCRHVMLPEKVEMNKGARLIGLPYRLDNPNVAGGGPAVFETLCPLWHGSGSTIRNGSLDRRPYSTSSEATIFNGVGDNGLWTPSRGDESNEQFMTMMNRGAFMSAPGGGIASIGRWLGDPGFNDGALDNWDDALNFDGNSLNVRKPLFNRNRPHITGVTFVGTGGTLFEMDGKSAAFRLQNDTAAIIAMSSAAEIMFVRVANNQNNGAFGHVKVKTDGIAGGQILASGNDFAQIVADLNGTTGTVGSCTLAPRDSALHLENREGLTATYYVDLEAILSEIP